MVGNVFLLTASCHSLFMKIYNEKEESSQDRLSTQHSQPVMWEKKKSEHIRISLRVMWREVSSPRPGDDLVGMPPLPSDLG